MQLCELRRIVLLSRLLRRSRWVSAWRGLGEGLLLLLLELVRESAGVGLVSLLLNCDLCEGLTLVIVLIWERNG